VTTFDLLLVDNDTLLAYWIKRELASMPRLGQIVQFSSGQTAIAFCLSDTAKVVLIEWALSDCNAASIVAQMARHSHPPKVLAFTGLADELSLYSMSRAAIHGIVWKTPDAVSELRIAIRTVLLGGRYFSIGAMAAISRMRRKPDAFFKILSDRELDLLPLLARGLGDEAIAARKDIRVATARSHRQHIMSKLGIHSTPALMCWAVDKGFAHAPRPVPPCELILNSQCQG
jgi:two-component system response regulator NreC